MRILGLDLSLRSTGFVLLADDEVEWSGVVGSDTLRDAARLQMFDVWIRQCLSHTDHRRIEHFAIEGYAFGAFAGREQLGELGGVIKLAIHQAEVPMTIVPPSVWKKALCGHGGLRKDLVRLELYKRYGVEFKSQDTLDAWAVATCLRRQLLGLDKPEPKSRRRKTLPQTSLSLAPAIE